jgi:hypothetical protein
MHNLHLSGVIAYHLSSHWNRYIRHIKVASALVVRISSLQALVHYFSQTEVPPLPSALATHMQIRVISHA